MRYALILTFAIVIAMQAALFSFGGTVGTSSIYAPAVILQNNSGELTKIALTVTTGTGNVSVVGPSEVAPSTVQSATLAVQAATSYLKLNPNDYNFTYNIMDAVNVSGPSAGTAMALLAISALTGKQLPSNFTVTGTITSYGAVGQIGGIYDKVSAAHSKGLSFVLVPKVQNDSFEAELYAMAQDAFSIPLVQVQNLSSASSIAFSPGNLSMMRSSFQFYSPYDLSLPEAPVACSNGCNPASFNSLVSFTFNFTSSEISTLPSSFADSVRGLEGALSQAESINGKGYSYFAANLAFLDYINAFVLSHHGLSPEAAASILDNASAYCGSLVAPPLTGTNYEYVLGGELRQAWGATTVADAMNVSSQGNLDSDGISSLMNSAAESTAWCRSADMMYSIASSLGGSQKASAGLMEAANSSIARAEVYGSNLYMRTARQAYSQGNYALAVLAGDYSYALYSTPNMTVGEMLNASVAMAHNSTFGVWASQFANEALFYARQASSINSSYAAQAYSTALLANQMSLDYGMINSSLVSQSYGSVTIDRGQSVNLTTRWSGGTSPYGITWSMGSSPQSCSSLLSSASSTATESSITVSPSSSAYYCATVTDSSQNPVTSLPTAFEVIVNPELSNQSTRGSVVGTSGVSSIQLVEALLAVGTAVAVFLALVTIRLYRLSGSRKSRTTRPGARARRRRPRRRR